MTDTLQDIAARMLAPGKGILAADEGPAIIQRRFDTIGLEASEENRRAYREVLFGTEAALRDNFSGVIMADDTIRQSAKDGTRFVDMITAAGAVPGIKVDEGVRPLAMQPGETITEGLDGLGERLKEYRAIGARFAKWRGVIDIGQGRPSRNGVAANAHALARYAALCQEVDIVPMVEPEVMMDGDHDIDTCYEITEWAQRTVFNELYQAGVKLDGMVLKPNMIVPGQAAADQASPEEVAEKTLRCLKSTVPATVPGIAFLSGGQSDAAASHHLSLINQAGPLPWTVTFSYGRALHAQALATWAGKPENVEAARGAFLHRARMNSLAATGKWQPEAESTAA